MGNRINKILAGIVATVVLINPFGVYANVNTNTKKVMTKNNYSEFWISATELNIRKKPGIDSEIIGSLVFNEKITASVINKNWAKLKEGGYIHTDYINKSQVEYIDYYAPETSGYKSFMPYDLFMTESKQYRLQLYCGTGNFGIRQYAGRYCVAIGSYFETEIGQFFDLILENGEIIPCVMADQKADIHTDGNNIITVANGCMTEFLVDYSYFDNYAKQMGDISYCCDEWNSKVAVVRVYNEKVEL